MYYFSHVNISIVQPVGGDNMILMLLLTTV